MRIFVAAVGVLAPGVPDWESARSLLNGKRSFVPMPLAPSAPASLAPAERRRSSPTVRLALAAAEQALSRQSISPADMATVFASNEASGVITHQLCEALAGSREVSPTQFHNSVHNAPSGYLSIAMKAKLAGTSICRGKWSFGAGLLNAAVQVLTDGAPVLYVCYDSPLPPPLCAVMPVTEPTAIALVLTADALEGSMGTWEIALAPGTAETAWPDWMPATWHVNATARGFALLRTLAHPSPTHAALPLSAELNVRVSRC